MSDKLADAIQVVAKVTDPFGFSGEATSLLYMGMADREYLYGTLLGLSL